MSGFFGQAMVSPAPATRPAATRPAVAVSALDGVALKRSDQAANTAPTTQATQNTPQGAPKPTFDVTRVLMSLALVIGLILFLKWGGKKFFALPSSGASGVMQVVSRTPLAPKQQLLLVRVGRRLVVVGDSAGRLTALDHITDADEVAQLLGQSQSAGREPASGLSFGGVFKRMGAGRSRTADEPDWSELESDAATTSGSERSGLFGSRDVDDLTSRPGSPLDTSADVDDATVDDLSDRRSGEPSGLHLTNEDEDEARAAVEAARNDIQALRARLREVTGRLVDNDENKRTDAKPGDREKPDAA